MPVNLDRVSIVLPQNDLESLYCARAARMAGIPEAQIVVLDVSWGGRINPVDPKLDDLTDFVILIELPDEQFEQHLLRKGKQILIIDHHVYAKPEGGLLDRRRPFSSLEQLLAFLPPIEEWSDGKSPPEKEPDGYLKELMDYLSANDRGFIPALAQAAKLGDRPDEDQDLIVRTLRAAEIEQSSSADSNVGHKLFDYLEKNPGDWKGAARAIENPKRDLKIAHSIAYLEWAFDNGQAVTLRDPRYARKVGDNGQVRPGELTILLAPKYTSRVVLDALYFYRQDKDRAALTNVHETVMLFYECNEPADLNAHDWVARADKQPLVQVEFSGRGNREQLISEAISNWKADGSPCARLHLWAGGGIESTFFGASGVSHEDSDRLSQLADELINNLAIGNRPLLMWRTHFLQPLVFKNFKDMPEELILPEHWEREKPSDETCMYFMEHVHPTLGLKGDSHDAGRGFTFRDNEELTSFVWKNPDRRLRLKFGAEPPHGTIRERADQIHDIEAIYLHIFFRGTVLVEAIISGSLDEKHILFQHKPLWQKLLSCEHDQCSMTMSKILDINAFGRFAASSFVTDEDADKTYVAFENADGEMINNGLLERGTKRSRTNLDGWFKALLVDVLVQFDLIAAPEDDLPVISQSDDRLKVLTSIVVSGSNPTLPAAANEMQVMMCRLQTVDYYAPWHTSDPRTALKELNNGVYDRFESDGSLYAITDHSFVFMGFGSFPAIFIHPNHNLTMYRRMFLLAQAYFSVIAKFSRDLVPSDRAQASDKTYRDYIRFRAKLFFKFISSQVQGSEIYDLILRNSRINSEVEQIEEEIKAIEDHRRVVIENQERIFQRKLGWAALIIGAITILEFPRNLEWLSEKIAPNFGVDKNLNVTLFLTSFAIIVVMLVAGYLIVRLFGKQDETEI